MQSQATKLNDVTKKLTEIPQVQPQPPTSYSEAVTRTPLPTPGPADQAIARAATRARQIMIDLTPGNLLFPLGTNHADIVSKTREVLGKVKPDNFTKNDDIKVITQLQNGGLTIKLTMKALSDWLRSPEGRAALMKELNLPANFCELTLGLVIQYLPTNLPIDRQDFLDLITKENQLNREHLSTICWIKPPHRRPASQLSTMGTTIQMVILNNVLGLAEPSCYPTLKGFWTRLRLRGEEI
ncbi:uncharacterized protein F5891DRAFT_1197958 [Suillus fuscotomentosus]|uniref:Uncharacterized protein n=1 Tax=Suillus fuscotomentosus TaxID=1912939 RepID=A0AAD4DR06_9AGAM|nr:uncharacterized protein F5891DRAFT_1197958 [Suillus fuscotomentosus]KAG1890617.1 hypothetical protein F5891DRAFT_1197958 [Suillus fuscotomentosus]